MTIGPIPESAIDAFCEKRKLDGETVRMVAIVMQRLDSVYMEWMREQSASNTTPKMPQPPEVKGGAWGDRRRSRG